MIMKHNKLKWILDATENDLKYVNIDYFCESLFLSILNTKDNLKQLDIKTKRIACAFVPYDRIIDCYDNIIKRVATKQELLIIYKTFVDWFKTLDEKYKKIFIAYYIRKDNKLCERVAKSSHFRSKYIKGMGYSFLGYLKMMTDFNTKKLLKNPYIYNMYVKVWVNRELGYRTKF